MYGSLLFQNLMSYVLKSNHALMDLRVSQYVLKSRNINFTMFFFFNLFSHSRSLAIPYEFGDCVESIVKFERYFDNAKLPNT